MAFCLFGQSDDSSNSGAKPETKHKDFQPNIFLEATFTVVQKGTYDRLICTVKATRAKRAGISKLCTDFDFYWTLGQFVRRSATLKWSNIKGSHGYILSFKDQCSLELGNTVSFWRHAGTMTLALLS